MSDKKTRNSPSVQETSTTILAARINQEQLAEDPISLSPRLVKADGETVLDLQLIIRAVIAQMPAVIDHICAVIAHMSAVITHIHAVIAQKSAVVAF
jgi:hypothetical protein